VRGFCGKYPAKVAFQDKAHAHFLAASKNDLMQSVEISNIGTG